MNLVIQGYHWFRINLPRTYRIGAHTLELPAGHRLDWYRLRHSRYDEPIREVVAFLASKYPDLTAIDVGANIGDTAALMSRDKTVAVLCIEGNERYLPLLRKNLRRVSPLSEIAECYVGADDASISGRVVAKDGTARIAVDGEDGRRIAMLTLSDILQKYPAFANSHFLKIDTDGFDVKIVLSSIALLRSLKPVLFVEYSPLGKEGEEQECREMIARLVEVGYCRFHVFDNFGNHMLCLEDGELHHLHSLNAYVRSTRRDIRPALFYYDICAMTARDIDISDKLRDLYLVQ